MKTIPLLLALLAAEEVPNPEKSEDRQSVIVVVGAEGTPEYGTEFRAWADRWEEVTGRAEARLVRIGLETVDATDRDRLRDTLAGEARESREALWLVLIGHGTFDGREAKFNLRGPDFSAAELAEWLKPFKRPLAVLNCSSSSGPFVNRLSAPDRVVVTATKSGYEHNYSRFGSMLAASIADESVDLDKDGQTSLLEAFLAASAATSEFYSQNGRLATEHALVDDNGDGRGTPATWFRGILVAREAKDGASPDGLRANQFHLVRTGRDRSMSAEARARRDELELAVHDLRQRKGELDETEYYDRLEPLLVDLARLYEESDKE